MNWLTLNKSPIAPIMKNSIQFPAIIHPISIFFLSVFIFFLVLSCDPRHADAGVDLKFNKSRSSSGIHFKTDFPLRFQAICSNFRWGFLASWSLIQFCSHFHNISNEISPASCFSDMVLSIYYVRIIHIKSLVSESFLILLVLVYQNEWVTGVNRFHASRESKHVVRVYRN